MPEKAVKSISAKAGEIIGFSSDEGKVLLKGVEQIYTWIRRSRHSKKDGHERKRKVDKGYLPAVWD